MAIYTACTVDLAPEAIKVRWQEPYVTSGLNQKTLGQQAKGVFAGFTVVPGGTGTLEVLLQVDPTLGFSGANVLDVTTSKYCVTVIQSSTVTVNLASVANGTVYLTLDAQYQIGASSGAQVKVVDAAELATNANLVLLAKVNVPATPDILATHINMGYRLSAGDSLPPEARPPINLIQNGTFERGLPSDTPQGWGNYSGFPAVSLVPQIDNTVFRSGTQSMRLFPVGAVTGGAASTPVGLREGQTARVSLWVRSEVANPIAGGNVEFSVNWFDTDYNEVGSSALEGTFTGNGTIFVQRQALVTAPATTAYAQVLILYNGCSGKLYVDDVEFLVRDASHFTQSPVFGGPAANADAYHMHAAASLAYGGGVAWADGQTNPATSVEGQFDKMLVDLTSTGAASGAGKIAYTATTPKDVTTARVDLALDELDDKKASLPLANTFASLNSFNASIEARPPVAPPAWTGLAGGPFAIVGRGSNSGDGHAIVGVGCAAAVGSAGVVGLATEAIGVQAIQAGVVGIGNAGFVPGMFAVGTGPGATGIIAASDDTGTCIVAYPLGGGKAFNALAGDVTISPSYGFKYSSARAMTSLITAARINGANAIASYSFGTAGPAVGSAVIQTGNTMVAGFQIDLPLNAVITGMTMGISHGALAATGLGMTYRVDQVVPATPWTLNQVYGSGGLATLATLAAGSGFEVVTATGLTGTTAFKTATEGRTFVGTITVFGTTTNFLYINYVAVTYDMLDWLNLP